MPTPKRALDDQQQHRDRDDRRAEHLDQAGRVERPDEQRQPEPGHARRAHAVDRDDEVQAGQDRREAGDEDAERRSGRRWCSTPSCCTACRTSSRCRRRRRPCAQSVNDAADHVDVPAEQVERGNARSFAPIISGIRKLPSTAGIDGIRKKNTMTTPCMREELVVGVGRRRGRPAASTARAGCRSGEQAAERRT